MRINDSILITYLYSRILKVTKVDISPRTSPTVARLSSVTWSNPSGLQFFICIVAAEKMWWLEIHIQQSKIRFIDQTYIFLYNDVDRMMTLLLNIKIHSNPLDEIKYWLSKILKIHVKKICRYQLLDLDSIGTKIEWWLQSTTAGFSVLVHSFRISRLTLIYLLFVYNIKYSQKWYSNVESVSFLYSYWYMSFQLLMDYWKKELVEAMNWKALVLLSWEMR